MSCDLKIRIMELLINIAVGTSALVLGIVIGKFLFDKKPVQPKEFVKFEDCFDSTGKGIGKYEGYKILNGNE